MGVVVSLCICGNLLCGIETSTERKGTEENFFLPLLLLPEMVLREVMEKVPKVKILSAFGTHGPPLLWPFFSCILTSLPQSPVRLHAAARRIFPR